MSVHFCCCLFVFISSGGFDGWTDGRTDGRRTNDERTDDGRRDGWTDGRTADGQTDGRTDAQTDGRIVRRTDERIVVWTVSLNQIQRVKEEFKQEYAERLFLTKITLYGFRQLQQGGNCGFLLVLMVIFYFINADCFAIKPDLPTISDEETPYEQLCTPRIHGFVLV